MYQSGHVGNKSINAWAVGSIVGYTLDMPWSPRLALQIDGASGDKHPGDGSLGTFNPLFLNGYYFTLAGIRAMQTSFTSSHRSRSNRRVT
jgi:hypothetical protein